MLKLNPQSKVKTEKISIDFVKKLIKIKDLWRVGSKNIFKKTTTNLTQKKISENTEIKSEIDFFLEMSLTYRFFKHCFKDLTTDDLIPNEETGFQTYIIIKLDLYYDDLYIDGLQCNYEATIKTIQTNFKKIYERFDVILLNWFEKYKYSAYDIILTVEIYKEGLDKPIVHRESMKTNLKF